MLILSLSIGFWIVIYTAYDWIHETDLHYVRSSVSKLQGCNDGLSMISLYEGVDCLTDVVKLINFFIR